MPAPRATQTSLLERFKLEEEAEPNLHGSRGIVEIQPSLLENASKSCGAGVGVDWSEIGVIENVLRFQPDFNISRIVATEMDLLEQGSIGKEATGIPNSR